MHFFDKEELDNRRQNIFYPLQVVSLKNMNMN